MLSEHSLYCNCINASEDDLSIIPQAGGVIGDFIPSMEMALNRLKSEYYLARKQYFEYIESINNYYSYDDEFYSELYNSELLNINIEKLKSSFRLCFGIFDKIAVAISKAYNIKNKKSFYFHNFWELGDNNRKVFFESIKSPGLLSLFSIAMDLNNKEGELGFFRNWRNALEHKFIIIYSGNSTEDLYDSYSYFNDIEFINEKDFLENFKLLINITRSAIFSFVFAIRHKGNENLEKNKNISFKNTINKKII
ncbi:LA2681 family HEPN domain-containing protein [Proteus terrae]|uniref:LA2681 family HEPN domain-containing protein n=1 Tax=Proteus terrae TaxID=1574161 RepID=UPI000D68C1C2|nr:LA2681 family HEPN domain-containing protein [Proteus terrae]